MTAPPVSLCNGFECKINEKYWVTIASADWPTPPKVCMVVVWFKSPHESHPKFYATLKAELGKGLSNPADNLFNVLAFEAENGISSPI